MIPENGLITQSSFRAGNQSDLGGIALSSQAKEIFQKEKPQYQVGALPMHTDGLADLEAGKNEDGTRKNRVQLLVLHCYIPSLKGGQNRLISGVNAFQLLKERLSLEAMIQLSTDSMNATRDGLVYPYIPLSLTSREEFAGLNWTFIVDEITRKKPLLNKVNRFVFKEVNKLLNNNKYILQLGLSSGQALAIINQGPKGFLHARRGFPKDAYREHEKIWSKSLPF